ncbi:hypothetical protein K144316041_23760 [Clostridium tetani]|nr:hypothetical protein [Clostridium tetani]BDR73365.1 hypothetical protein K144316041_20730 [Clostridium tetani]BDR73668.1 hypothetical protein K144316041_23760 [Clostridium tetani]
MGNKETIDQAIEIYFKGRNWQRFLKEQVKKRECINIKNIEGDK